MGPEALVAAAATILGFFTWSHQQRQTVINDRFNSVKKRLEEVEIRVNEFPAVYALKTDLNMGTELKKKKQLIERLNRRLLSESEMACPRATQDLELNTRNRNKSIEAEYIQYGPLNLNDEEYWERYAKKWKTEPEVAKKSNCGNCVAFDISPRMDDCMPGEVSDEEGRLGYCWMHHFKCHSARTCYTWAAGGPITDDKVSYDWQQKNQND